MNKQGPVGDAETRDAHVELAEQYLLDGSPLDPQACVDLMRHPEVIASQLNGWSRLVLLAEATGKPEMEPGAHERLETLQKLAVKGAEMGYGDNDYRGDTSVNTNLTGAAAIQGRHHGARRGHRRRAKRHG